MRDINKDNIQVFPSLYDFLCANELKLTDNVKCDIAKHLSELDVQLRRYFPPKRMTQTTGFVIPFMPSLQSTYKYLNKRASSKLQQAVL
uniref:SJCHGC03035 protein n=1 Tax=Schistosoma japonicum TaxID=6182 RepID=Q5BSZ4_SCHJA|nr:SJCHGC03035 protein [Schistosoma japonicum]